MKLFVGLMVLTICSSHAFPQSLDLAEFGAQNTAYVEIKGNVQDGRTSLPIKEANVFAIWEATSYGFHSSTRHCLRVAAGQTDAQGRFSIMAPASDVFRRGMAQQYVEVRIHKEGFNEQPSDSDELGRAMTKDDQKRPSLAALTQGGLLTERHLNYSARLYPLKQDSHERLRALRQFSQLSMGCETNGESKAIGNYFDGIANEANHLARTRYEQALAAVITERARNPIVSSNLIHDTEAKIMGDFYSAPAELDDLDRRDREDETPLMKAAEVGNAPLVENLLQQGANPNRTRRTGDLIGPDSALTIAMNKYGWEKVDRKLGAKKYLAVIATLLSNSTTNPNLRNRSIDYTPLMKALERGQDDVVDLLLKAGADPNLTAYGKKFNALHIAAKLASSGNNSAGVAMPSAANQFQIILASKRLDLNMPTTYEGQTALTEAVSLANTKIARQLLEAGADPNAQNLAKQTPLIVIAQNALLNPTRSNHVETFKLIAGWPGVRLDAKYEGKTAQEMVQQAGRKDLAQIIASGGK